MARLSVDLNRDGLHEIAAPSSFETDGPFEIRLRNHGEAIHVHLNLDDELSTVAALNETNHYVAAYSRRSVQIDTRGIDTPVTGRLKIITAYGAETVYTSVTVSPPGTVTKRVQVDEQLAKPAPREPPEPSFLEQLRAVELGGISPQVIGLGVAVVGIALLIPLISGNSIALVGSLAVVVAAVAALAITRRK